MRVILTICIIGSAVFAGYWVISAQTIARIGPDALAQTHRIDAQSGKVTGFPLAFRTEWEDLRWQNDDRTIVWHVPHVEFESASYRPNQISARFSPTHSVDYAGQPVELQHNAMVGNLSVDQSLSIVTAALNIDSATATPPLLLQDMDSLRVTMERTAPDRYDLSLAAQGLHLSPELRQAIDPRGSHPDQIAYLALTADTQFNAPLTLNSPMPLPHSMDIQSMRLDWGEMRVTGTGQLARAETGGLDGTLSLTLEDWRVLHALLVETGTIDGDAAMMAGLFLGSQAQSGSTQITLTLNVRDSVVALGPFTLAHLPRF
ncbi:MAG: DUF2125 domain-containing protein [Roseinatronobacter sp.]|nr:MAG: DUF2125 domain-containing protein [Roseinatronobacter sp.]